MHYYCKQKLHGRINCITHSNTKSLSATILPKFSVKFERFLPLLPMHHDYYLLYKVTTVPPPPLPIPSPPPAKISFRSAWGTRPSVMNAPRTPNFTASVAYVTFVIEVCVHGKQR